MTSELQDLVQASQFYGKADVAHRDEYIKEGNSIIKKIVFMKI
jgi:hypothetical protein